MANYENFRNIKCARCTAKKLHEHQFYYHCKECRTDRKGKPKGIRYDVCKACVLTRAGVLGKTERFKVHNQGLCEFQLQDPADGKEWSCLCADLKADGTGCSSRHNELQCYPDAQWLCKKCDVSLCLKCCLKYRLPESEKEVVQKAVDSEKAEEKSGEENKDQDAKLDEDQPEPAFLFPPDRSLPIVMWKSDELNKVLFHSFESLLDAQHFLSKIKNTSSQRLLIDFKTKLVDMQDDEYG